MRLLLEAGADKVAKSDVRLLCRFLDPFFRLPRISHVHCTRLFRRNTCPHQTSFFNSRGIAMVLGANTLQYQDTALNNAARQGQADCVRLLVEAGADKETHNDVHDLVLILALLFEWTRIFVVSNPSHCCSHTHKHTFTLFSCALKSCFLDYMLLHAKRSEK